MTRYKYKPYILIVIMAILTWTACDKDDPDKPQIYRWDFTAQFDLDDKAGVDYTAVGYADFELYANGDFEVSCTYSVGNIEFSDVILEGVVEGDSARFTTETIILEFDVEGTAILEEVKFELDPADVSCKEASGNGTFQQRILPAGDWETGTFYYEAERPQ